MTQPPAPPTTPLLPELCEGWVSHQRLRPRAHTFTYRVFYLRIPLTQLPQLGNRWLSRDAFNLMSVVERDYGPRDNSDLGAWVRGILADAAFPACADAVILQTFPRVLGYVFNPVSLWFVHDRARALRAVICEVSDTFGERHNYLVAHADARPIPSDDILTARKLLHVSPFCPSTGHYRFRFRHHHGCWTTTIDYYDGPADTDRLLLTTIGGTPRALSAWTTLGAFVRFPLFTLGVTARIHWQAVRLWWKRVPWFAKPAPPANTTSF